MTGRARISLLCLLVAACGDDQTRPPPPFSHPPGPQNSDLAASINGGGCYPTALKGSEFDQIVLTNPHWAPVVNGRSVESEPILVHGIAHNPHADTGGDYPFNHVHSDANISLELDAEDSWALATGNGTRNPTLEFEWENVAYPIWALAGEGDRVVAMGRWIFDCGHPGGTPGRCSQSSAVACILDSDCAPPSCPTCADPDGSAAEKCQGQHFEYQSELHPPYAAATIRAGRGAVVSDKDATPVPATRADIYVSADAGPASDRCTQTHQDSVRISCSPPTATR